MNTNFYFRHGGVIHNFQLGSSNNSKIGFGMLLQTYHISEAQLTDHTKDKKNCLGCVFSHSKGGGCYTHKGHSLMGVKSKIRSINRIGLENIQEFNLDTLKLIKNFYNFAKSQTSLIRMGAYGESVTMPNEVVSLLSKFKNRTAYTQRWRGSNFQGDYMASVSTLNLKTIANERGYKTFRVLGKNDIIQADEIVCPASKEAKKSKTCITCKLCNGSKMNIAIYQH
jgi:hypothetical protein